MGLFSRRKAVVAEAAWTPLRQECLPLSGDEASMDDDGQVFASAYEIGFGMLHPDGAVITIWTYVSYHEDDRYCLGLRYQYTSEAHPDWSYTGYEGDPWGEVFDDSATAESEARDWADSLAAGNADSISNLSGVFDWDGDHFPFAAQDADYEGDPG